MVSQTIAATEGTVATVPRYDRQMSISNGAIILDIQVDPGEKRCRAKKLNLHVVTSSEYQRSSQPASGPVLPKAQAWSLSRGEWVKLNTSGPPHPSSGGLPGPGEMEDARTSDYAIKSPGDFMTEDGVVRVRLSAQSEVEIIKIGLTGEIEAY